MRTWGLGDMSNLKNNKKRYSTLKVKDRGFAAVKFAKLFTSRDQEEAFGEHSLSYTLTLNDVEAKYFPERARDS